MGGDQTAGQGVPPAAMRAARRRWASGVAALLAPDGAGEFRGLTLAAFAVVSLQPPLVLACLDREGRMASLVPEAGVFAVSILDRRHELLAERFAARGPLVDARLTGVPHDPAPSGVPILRGALAWFDCRVQAVHAGGDHVVVVGLVAAAGVGDDSDDPLLYYEGRYRGIEPS